MVRFAATGLDSMTADGRGANDPSSGDVRIAMRGVEKHASGASRSELDSVVVEEPLEIRLDDVPFVVTMRTPGDDFDLAYGLLYSEAVIDRVDDVASIAHCPTPEDVHSNVVRVVTAPGRSFNTSRARRSLAMTASCGICGKETIDSVRVRVSPIVDGVRVSRQRIASLPAMLRSAQRVFAATGGLHAVGLFRSDGAAEVTREDVGRHNAADKVIGAMLRRAAVTGDACSADGRLELTGRVMMFSGRAGFEVVQKAAVARIPIVCSVSAPSSLAIDLAEEVGVTLVCFVRGDAMNVYTHTERVV